MPTPLAVEEFLSIQVRLIVQNKFNGVARMRSHNAERTEEIQPLIHGKVLIGSRSYAPGNLAPVMEQKGINVAAEIGMEPLEKPKDAIRGTRGAYGEDISGRDCAARLVLKWRRIATKLFSI
jgi:hypothetical protein